MKKFDNMGEDTDDLISIGTVGLIKGIDTFNPERGTRLATYAGCLQPALPSTVLPSRYTRVRCTIVE